MSDFERKKIITNKNRPFSNRESSSGRIFTSRGGVSIKERDVNSEGSIKQPTILLKPRESNIEDNSFAKKKQRENEAATSNQASKEIEGTTPVLKHMKKSIKLIEDGIMNTEHVQEYLQENSDFIVVAVVGTQHTGKSAILNLLTHEKITDSIKKNIFHSNFESKEDFEDTITLLQRVEESQEDSSNIFKVHDLEDTVDCTNTTQGIDIYVSSNRVIFLDCQPFIAVSPLYDLINSENKRTNLVNDFIPLENSGEIQGLQYTAFLMSVCHILLLVQDWRFDCNVVRFLQSAEMLKPTKSNPEDDCLEHFPHLIMIQNRAQMADFTPKEFKILQKTYDALLKKTKLQFHTNLGIGSGRIMKTLSPENCGNPVNLFLIPEEQIDSDDVIYWGHPPLEDLIKKLRANLFEATKNSLTHVQLTEKTWLVYCNKVWETVRKSPFFVEYTKLMP
ncbi:unnamed protein product [Ceutorhynchus assimilis]|uniref:Protein SMG9 n=1 Tax=Ceutorhynchus assimilis TaxID=467358 RepID=A0A9N9QKP3_9CUCU|nr:unnamed protein product [Ceutorhynchus assimilis]